jgi:all-trans-retinol 13,14-reductase
MQAMLEVSGENLSFTAGLAVSAGVLFLVLKSFSSKPNARAANPFEKDTRDGDSTTYEFDEEKRNAVLKNGYTEKKLEKTGEDFDAIIIGSGMGGLTTAALMARAGKKVLVLEAHDQCGGCCHSFSEKGYEFDTGK